jgi:hypothetical protein
VAGDRKAAETQYAELLDLAGGSTRPGVVEANEYLKR